MKGLGKVFISTILLITLQFSLFGVTTECAASNRSYWQQVPADTSIKTKPADSTVKPIKISKNTVKSKVDYTARDSIRFDIEKQRLYLFGDANVKYEKIELKAGYVELDFEKNSVFAAGTKDSSGKLVEKPIFSENGKPINSDTMYYNFKTKKGKIKVIRTEEGEGHIAARIAKKDSNDITFIRYGHYTTCSLDHPHFYIGSNKMKVIPNDKIVTGPAILVMGDIPTPLMIPFGFFPNRKGRANGILIPTYGDSPSMGFSLQDGGYYFGLGDNFDMTLRGDIYSRGSWAVKAASNYLKRYRYMGNFNIRVGSIRSGEKIYTDYSESNDFAITWMHTQDQKASPTSKFSANVNFVGNGTYYRNMPNNITTYTTNTTNSAVTWNKTGSNFNLSTGLTLNQNTTTHLMNISLPNALLSMNRIYPTSFFRKEAAINSKWYDKIGISYTSQFQNSVSMLDRNIIKPSVFDSMKAGIQHAIPLSTTFNLNPFTITPSVNFNSQWYFDYSKKYYTQVRRPVINGKDTIMGYKDTIIYEKVQEFNTVNTYNVGLSATTKLYGFYKFKNSKVKVIRHVLTPTVGFSYRPDYSLPKYNYYAYTNDPSKQYSYFERNVFGFPPAGKSGTINFGINNNLEMKVRPSKKDTSDEDKKVILIEGFAITSYYNLATGELANFSLGLFTKLFKTLNVNVNALLNPHKLSETGTDTKQLVWKEGKIGSITSANLSLSTNLNSSKKDNPKQNDSKQPETPKNIDQAAAQLAYIQSHPGYYVDFNVPWNVNINYTLSYSKPIHIAPTTTINENTNVKKPPLFSSHAIAINGDFSLTPKWKISAGTGYDLVNLGISPTNLTVYRDLHCWEMSFNWLVGTNYQSYTLNINVKSSVLKDLKLTRRKNWQDYQ